VPSPGSAVRRAHLHNLKTAVLIQFRPLAYKLSSDPDSSPHHAHKHLSNRLNFTRELTQSTNPFCPVLRAAVKDSSVASTHRVSTYQIASCYSLSSTFYCSQSWPIKLYRSLHSGTPNRPVERRRDALSVNPLFYSCLVQIQACT